MSRAQSTYNRYIKMFTSVRVEKDSIPKPLTNRAINSSNAI